MQYLEGAIGNPLFTGVKKIVAALIIFVTPALTSGSIALEQEQRTFEFLLMTRLSEAGIIWGKLLAALSFPGILVLCSLPVTALAFLFGGVSLWQFIAVAMGILLLLGAESDIPFFDSSYSSLSLDEWMGG
jgi:ABC-type transport system involved in multi-copper enzyme maturation permease subunit